MPEADAPPAIAADDDFALVEIAAWSDAGLDAIVGRSGAALPPHPGQTSASGGCRLLRLTPRLAWALAEPGAMPAWDVAGDGVLVDLGNSRVRFKLQGRLAAALTGQVGVDLRAIAAGGFALTTLHAVPVAVLVVPSGLEVLVPRSFSLSLASWIADAAVVV